MSGEERQGEGERELEGDVRESANRMTTDDKSRKNGTKGWGKGGEKLRKLALERRHR